MVLTPDYPYDPENGDHAFDSYFDDIYDRYLEDVELMEEYGDLYDYEESFTVEGMEESEILEEFGYLDREE